LINQSFSILNNQIFSSLVVLQDQTDK